MHAEDAVLAIITALPDRRIKGKKRLQKLAFFLKSAGAKFDARFRYPGLWTIQSRNRRGRASALFERSRGGA